MKQVVCLLCLAGCGQEPFALENNSNANPSIEALAATVDMVAPDTPMVRIVIWDGDEKKWMEEKGGLYNSSMQAHIVMRNGDCWAYTALVHELLHHRQVSGFDMWDYDHEDILWLTQMQLHKDVAKLEPDCKGAER